MVINGQEWLVLKIKYLKARGLFFTMYLCSKQGGYFMNFTNSIILNVLLTILYAFAIMIIFNLANIYFLKKYNLNKWIALGISIATFLISLVIVGYYPTGAWHLIPLTISLFAFMWFIDLRRKFKSTKNMKKVVMKPHVKPSRAKIAPKADIKPAAPQPKKNKK